MRTQMAMAAFSWYQNICDIIRFCYIQVTVTIRLLSSVNRILPLKNTSISVNIEMFNNPINSRKQQANRANPVVVFLIFVEKKK